jgi:5-methyltetrahydropteroyltriglutamate--homocysteine methyltransferase
MATDRNYRADHVGSLLRPPELLQARTEYLQGRITPDALRAAEDRAISAVLEKQRLMGLDIVSDGEMRRGSWLTDMADAVEGFVPDKVMLHWKGPGGGVEGSTANAVGAKLRKVRKMNSAEVPFLKENAAAPYKVTIPAPSGFMIASYKSVTEPFYPTRDDLLRDLVEIVRDEVRWLVSEGVRYIQFDAPYYSHYLDPNERERMRESGLDPDREFGKSIAADNAAFQDVPRDHGITRALHVCRGNSRSRWYAEGGYDEIAEKLFASLDVDRFLLEYDSPRSGGFEPLRLVPAGKTVVLGLVTTKTPELESEDVLRRRIDEAARYVPLENLALSPQCGFASTAAGNLLSFDDQWRKLELVVSTAKKAWG